MATAFSSSVLASFRRALGRMLHGHPLDACIVSHVVALDALGWRVVEFRPSFID